MYDTDNKDKKVYLSHSGNDNFKLILSVFVLGILIYIIAQIGGIFLTSEEIGPMVSGGNPIKVLITDLIFLSLALIAILLLTKGKIANYGLKIPDKEVHWSRIVGTGLLLGSMATITIIILGAGGNPNLKGLDVRGKILLIWILASISEEIFVRGLLQSQLNSLKENKFTFRTKYNISYPVVFSASFFGMMHLPLILFGADLLTVAIIFGLTLIMGYFAASLREEYESIIPSFGIHIATNIGGTMVGPMVYALLIGA